MQKTRIDPKDFYPACWDEARYDRNHDGKPEQYGIPAGASDRALYYNESALIKAGFVDSDGNARPPRTWQEVLTKRSDSRDGHVKDGWLTSESVDFVKAGVKPGDLISMRCDGLTRLANVAEDISAHKLKLLPKGYGLWGDQPGVWFKIFDGSGYLPKLSRWDTSGTLWRIGIAPVSWVAGNSWLYLYAWQNGGRFMSPDGKTCTMDDPKVVAALQWLTDCYDALGGYKAVSALESSYQSGWLDPFLTDKVCMRVDGSGFLALAAKYRKDMPLGVAPAPMPADHLAKGRQPISWLGGWSYAIPSTARHKEAAWRFIKWMCSLDANMLQQNQQRDIATSQGQLFMPELAARRSITKACYRAFITGNPQVPARFAKAYDVFVNLLPRSLYRPVTPVGQLLWNEHRRATEQALSHDASPTEALRRGTHAVQAQLDRTLAPPPGPVVAWGWIIAAYGRRHRPDGHGPGPLRSTQTPDKGLFPSAMVCRLGSSGTVDDRLRRVRRRPDDLLADHELHAV